MKTKHAVWIAFFLNLSYAIVEFYCRRDFGSSAVLADSVHDLGDAIAIGISAFWKVSPIGKKTATIPWATSALAF